MTKTLNQDIEWLREFNTVEFRQYLIEHQELWFELKYLPPQVTRLLEKLFNEGVAYADRD
jgi:hypothetical protein